MYFCNNSKVMILIIIELHNDIYFLNATNICLPQAT